MCCCCCWSVSVCGQRGIEGDLGVCEKWYWVAVYGEDTCWERASVISGLGGFSMCSVVRSRVGSLLHFPFLFFIGSHFLNYFPIGPQVLTLFVSIIQYHKFLIFHKYSFMCIDRHKHTCDNNKRKWYLVFYNRIHCDKTVSEDIDSNIIKKIVINI